MDWWSRLLNVNPCQGMIHLCSAQPIVQLKTQEKEKGEEEGEELHLSELIRFALEWRDKAENLTISEDEKKSAKMQACLEVSNLHVIDEQELDAFVSRKSAEFEDLSNSEEQRFIAAYSLYQYLINLQF
jgi:hypothetical protein